ncbi:MAG: YetF domain-containing protein [Clostridia bacterium]
MWQLNFDFASYPWIIISSVAVYVFMVIAIRIFGKKELAQLSVSDLVFILLISNAVQTAMVGPDTTLYGGLIAAMALFLTNFGFKKLLYKFPGLSKIVQGEAILLIYKGELITENMKRAQITLDEVHEAVREHGVESIKHVDLAVFEVDGNISVLSENYTRKSSKRTKAHRVLRKEV